MKLWSEGPGVIEEMVSIRLLFLFKLISPGKK